MLLTNFVKNVSLATMSTLFRIKMSHRFFFVNLERITTNPQMQCFSFVLAYWN